MAILSDVLLLRFGFFVFIGSAIITGILTAMSVVGLYLSNSDTPDSTERLKNGFFVYSAILAGNLALIFVMTLEPGRLQFEHPVLLAVLALAEAIAMYAVITGVLQAFREHFTRD